MSYKTRQPGRDWQVVEILNRLRGVCTREWYDDEGDQRIENAVDDDVFDMLSQLRLLVAAGDPPDGERGHPIIQKVGVHIVKAGKNRFRVNVKVLKGKPGHWRAYFIVPDYAACRAVFLHTVAKKTDPRDPADLKHCKRLIDDYYAGKYDTREIGLPSR